MELGLSDAEFYALTPRQLNALILRKEIAEQRPEFMLAQLTACVVNFSQARPKRPSQPRDFMPSMAGKKRNAEHDIQAEANALRAFFARWNKQFERGK